MSAYDPEIVGTVSAVIASGTESAEVNLLGQRLVAMFIPATFEGTSISFLVRNPAGTFVPLYQNGTLVTCTVSVSQMCAVPDIIPLIGAQIIKIKSNNSVAASRTVTLVTREV